jgi:hypothetical protein
VVAVDSHSQRVKNVTSRLETRGAEVGDPPNWLASDDDDDLVPNPIRPSADDDIVPDPSPYDLADVVRNPESAAPSGIGSDSDEGDDIVPDPAPPI